MIAALDAYLATAPLAEVLTYAGLALLAVFATAFTAGHTVDHVAAVRGGR